MGGGKGGRKNKRFPPHVPETSAQGNKENNSNKITSKTETYVWRSVVILSRLRTVAAFAGPAASSWWRT